MALTVDELILQASILTEKTDASTNPNMVYKPSNISNKALDPSFFTGHNTKIVNAINLLAKHVKSLDTAVLNMLNKTNGVMLNIDDYNNLHVWKNTQELMGKNTLIEGIENILNGNRQSHVLGLKPEDIGKVLSVDTDENGDLITRAIDLAMDGPISSLDVSYNNESKPELTNVSDALDFLMTKTGKPIDWSIIENKPQVPNGLVLTDDALVMREDDQDISKVMITSDEDINNIVGSL